MTYVSVGGKSLKDASPIRSGKGMKESTNIPKGIESQQGEEASSIKNEVNKKKSKNVHKGAEKEKVGETISSLENEDKKQHKKDYVPKESILRTIALPSETTQLQYSSFADISNPSAATSTEGAHAKSSATVYKCIGAFVVMTLFLVGVAFIAV